MQRDNIDFQLVESSLAVDRAIDSLDFKSDERAWSMEEIFQLLGRKPLPYQDVDSFSIE
jgi:hypothetical protein